MQNTIKVRFEGSTVAEANKAALELQTILQRTQANDVSLEIQRSDQTRQDFGATLVVVLGTPAALAIAKGIHDYIAKRGNRVVIENIHGKVVATGDAAKNIDVARTAEAMFEQD